MIFMPILQLLQPTRPKVSQNIANNHSLMSLLKDIRTQLHSAIKDKHIKSIHRLIEQLDSSNAPATDWTRYIVQIFAMLTDPEIEMPTFVRRNYIFAIFKLAVQVKVVEEGVKAGQLRQIVELLIRICETIFSAIASRREIDAKTQNPFHSELQKLLLLLHNSQQPTKQTLSGQKLRILAKLYPIQSLKVQGVQFIYPDLLLWYELFITLRNHLKYTVDQHKVVNYLSEMGICVKLTKEPVIRWVEMYTMMQEVIRVCGYWGSGCGEIESVCIKTAITALTEIREYFADYLTLIPINDKNPQDRTNMLKASIRFDIIYLTFCLAQTLNPKSNPFLYGVLLEEIRKAIAVMLPRIVKERQAIYGTDQKMLYERMFKHEMQLRWMDYQVEGALGANKEKEKQKELGMRTDWGRNCKLFKALLDNQKRPEQEFKQVLETQIAKFRQEPTKKLSQCVQMSQLILVCSPIIDQNIQQFKSTLQVLSAGQRVCVLSALVVEYHISNRSLLNQSIKASEQVLSSYFTTPSSFQSPSQLSHIQNAVQLISLCRKEQGRRVYACVYCGTLELRQFCATCGQASGEIAYAGVMGMDLLGKWDQFLGMCGYFMGEQIGQVREQLVDELRSILNLSLN